MRQNYRHSEETKRKIAEARRGIKPNEEARLRMSIAAKKSTNKGRFIKGQKPWNSGLRGVQAREKHPMWGKHPSQESIKKRINTFVLNGKMKGEKHHNWRGGITPIYLKIRNSEEYKSWRKKIFERDGYACVLCGHRGRGLVADHKKPFALFPELRFSIENGRTLCDSCHRKTDTFAGRTTYGEKWKISQMQTKI